MGILNEIFIEIIQKICCFFFFKSRQNYSFAKCCIRDSLNDIPYMYAVFILTITRAGAVKQDSGCQVRD